MRRTTYAMIAATLMVALLVTVTPLAFAATSRQTRPPLNIGVIVCVHGDSKG